MLNFFTTISFLITVYAMLRDGFVSVDSWIIPLIVFIICIDIKIKKHTANNETAEQVIAKCNKKRKVQKNNDIAAGAICGAIATAIFNKKSQPKETAADRFLKEKQQYYANDTQRHLQNNIQKERLLQQAAIYDDQARYGSAWERKQAKQNADDLRKQAYRL